MVWGKVIVIFLNVLFTPGMVNFRGRKRRPTFSLDISVKNKFDIQPEGITIIIHTGKNWATVNSSKEIMTFYENW